MNLIEEAAKAILDVAEMPESVRNERVCEWARRDARAALAVFEKAEATDWEYVAKGDGWTRRFDNRADAEKWRHRGYVISRRRREVPAGPWEPVPDDDTTPKEGSMTVSHYKLTETFEIIRVHPERDSILDLREAAGIYSDEDCTWTVEGSCVVFKRPLGSSLVPMADPS